ncbi:GATA zinc finger domain-containing protein 14-like isoform X2 [Panonychus citri]|uniref:GATA zinc finger domain-containing protein 14-like isoform X2 n=1 Tax=Panonychus citri TaxID=50023 RepID=UPI002306E0D7|nr:GATA zinc finger domain-containing protein 14-like isoform X2 [Panonychus citri]
MIYLRSKRVDNLKDHRSNNSSFQQSSFHSSNHHHGSFGDSSSNQTGSSSLERGGDEDANSKTKCFTLSMDRVDYGEIAGEFNPSIKSDSINNSKRKSQQKEINKSDDNCQQKTQSSDVEICLKSIDQGHLLSTITSSSLSVPISSPNPSSINNLSSSSPSLLTFPLSSSSLSSPSSSSSSSPQSPASSPSQSLTTITNIVNHHHHHHHNQHTPSSLNSLQARVKEKSAQFNGQFCGQTNTNVQIVSNLSPQPFRRSNRLSRRDLSIAPKLLDPEALSSPSPTAIEFLSRLREVISSARGRMRAFRFKPTLLVIPEDDYFISELKSKDKSISLSTTSDSSSMGSPSSLESESELQMNRNETLLSQEALSMYQQQYQQDNSYQQPLSLPVAISTVSQSNSWKSSVNQFRPKLLSFGSSRRASDNSKAKVTTKEIAFSDSELSNDRSHEPRHEHQLSSSLSSIYKKNCDSSMMITAWGDDKASKVSRREIVDRLAEEMVTVNDDQNVTISNENGNMEQTNYSNEPDSLNDLSDINENLFETKGNHNNNNSGNNNYDDTISSENLANLSNEVEKKLAQRSIVPLPEVVTEITETYEEPNSTGNEMITSRFPLETWSLSSEPSNGSSSPNYNQNNNSINKNSVNINIDMIGEENYARQTIVDPLTLDDDEMFITFAGNEFESNGNEGEVGYISRFNLIKKYIDDPNIFSDKGKGDDEQQVNGEDYLEEERSLSSTINENSNENNNILRNQMITMSLSDSSASSSESSSSNNHYNSTSNVINSTNSMKPWKSIDSKHLQSSPQSLPLLSSLSSIRSSPSSSAHLYPLDMCSSDDCLSSASVSSIMFMESPKQGRRNSVDHRLNRQSIDITERDNQINYGNNNNNNDDVINSSMMVRGSSNRGNWNNKLNQRSNNGIRLNRQSPVEKRHFPNGLMTIA